MATFKETLYNLLYAGKLGWVLFVIIPAIIKNLLDCDVIVFRTWSLWGIIAIGYIMSWCVLVGNDLPEEGANTKQ